MSETKFKKKRTSQISRRRPSGGRSPKRGNRNIQKIDQRRLIHVGKPVEETTYQSENTFDSLDLHDRLKGNLKKIGFTSPTEIQDKSLKAIQGLKDVLGLANTGTGKTGAFLIPIINSLLTEKAPFKTLVMVPTRELALQVEEDFRKFTQGMKFFITSAIGGQSIGRDIKNLKRQNHVVVGTPGRLRDLSERRVLFLDQFSVLILDEFDRMLDMGFTKDVNYLTGQMTSRDQTLLFSATIDNGQKAQVDLLLNDPVEIRVNTGKSTAEHINQDVIHEGGESKFPKLLEMMADNAFEKVLVFAETKRSVSKVTKNLKHSGVTADEIHGDKTQAYRQKALQKFKAGRVKVLVATDVAARGLDISDVTHVINYDMPQNYETYIHRIGRTGRAGKAGNALTFLN